MAGVVVFVLATVILVTWLLFRRQFFPSEGDGGLMGVQFSSKHFLVMSSLTLALAIAETISLILDGDAVRLPFIVVASGLTVWLWWKAWRSR